MTMLSRRHTLGLFSLALLAPQLCLAAERSAAETIDRYLELSDLGKLRSEECQALLTGPAADWEDGSVPYVVRHNRLIMVNATEVVARVSPVTPEGDTVDLYFYLTSASGPWQVADMRTLWLGGLTRQMRDVLKAKTPRSAEEDAGLRNLELTLSSDAQLTAWLADNMADMDNLAALSRAGADIGEIDALCRTLGLTDARNQDGLIIATIGGIIDNTVGFMHAGTGALPTISPSEYIWIEPLSGGWALFKTT